MLHHPPELQNSKIFNKRKIPEIEEGSTKIYRLCQLLPKNIPRLSEKLLVFYELLKADKQIKVTEELLDN